jgi:hypothetical protein
MTNRRRHSSAEVEAAVRYAEELGWRVIMGSGHNWARLFCPKATREGCQVGVYCTPKNAGNHARHIRSGIDRCPHGDTTEEGGQAKE